MNEAFPQAVRLIDGQLDDVPEHDDWLSVAERAVLFGLRLDRRRADWRLGRWLGKLAVMACSRRPLSTDEFSILAGEDGAPEVHGAAGVYTISISHRAGHGLAAVAPGVLQLGCDLEFIEPRSNRFINDYLTPAERDYVIMGPPEQQPLRANLVWSGKESMLKALRTGLRSDTRSIEVRVTSEPGPGRDWGTLILADAAQGELPGWWQQRRGFVRTVVTGS